MAKITGPLMSLDASGSIASTITFSKWKGRNYVRQLVKPANPKSAAQTAFRAMFGFLSSQWKNLSPTQQGTWATLAAAGNFSPFNAFTKENQRRWTQVLTPTAENPPNPTTGAGVIASYTATGGVRQIELTVTAGAGNDGWGIIVYRNAVTGFIPTQNDVVQVNEFDWAAPQSYVDSGLVPGTYFYRIASFSFAGEYLLNATEQSATAT